MDKIDWFPQLERAGQGAMDFMAHPYLAYSQVGVNYGPRVY
jgi:hypothetical protein